MVLVESFSKKLKMSKGTNQPTRYPHRMKNQIFPESSEIFRQMSGEFFFNNINCGEHLGFHVPKDILSSKSREQSNGQAYDALRFCKCTKCISDARVQLFCATFCTFLQLFAICFQTEEGLGNQLLWKIKTRNKQKFSFDLCRQRAPHRLPLLFYTGDFSSYHMLLLTLFCQIKMLKAVLVSNWICWEKVLFGRVSKSDVSSCRVCMG